MQGFRAKHLGGSVWIEFFLAAVLHQVVFVLVKNGDGDVLIAHDRQLNGLLDEVSFLLAIVN